MALRIEFEQCSGAAFTAIVHRSAIERAVRADGQRERVLAVTTAETETVQNGIAGSIGVEFEGCSIQGYTAFLGGPVERAIFCLEQTGLGNGAVPFVIGEVVEDRV